MFEVMRKDLCRENILVDYFERGAFGKPTKSMGIRLILKYLPSFLDKAWNYIFTHISSIRILIIKYLKTKIIINQYPNTQKEFINEQNQETLLHRLGLSLDLG